MIDSPLIELYRHNLWANLQLLDACKGLTEEQLDFTAPGTYGSVRNTLIHLVGAESRYVTLLLSQPPDMTVHESKGFPGIEALRESAQRSGEALIQVAGEAQPGVVLRGVRRGEPYEIEQFVALVQAINHATEHRSHVVGILSQKGIAMPDLDGWAYGEERKKERH